MQHIAPKHSVIVISAITPDMLAVVGAGMMQFTGFSLTSNLELARNLRHDIINDKFQMKTSFNKMITRVILYRSIRLDVYAW